MAHLRATMRAEGMRPVKPHPIHKIRWSGSHKEVIEAEYRHAPIWSKHTAEISGSTSYSKTQRFKATFLNNFESDKYARITSAIMLDTQALIGRASKEFQYQGESVYFLLLKMLALIFASSKGASIIGVGDHMEEIKDGFSNIKCARSKWMKEFLFEAKCPANVQGVDLMPHDEGEVNAESGLASFLPNSATQM